MRTDVIVLGAGIIGVSVALHLQARGRAVTLVDRRGPGEETSFGNAGLIERASVIPYAFPRSVAAILKYGLNRSADARYDAAFLPKIAPWLFDYWRHSGPARLAEAAAAMLPLIERSLAEHRPLMDQADATHFLRTTGWLEAYRSERTLAAALAETATLGPYGLDFEILDAAGLMAEEPHLREGLVGGIHWRDPASVSDPGGVTKAYAALFEARGGRVVAGDARSLAASGKGWSVSAGQGAGDAVEASAVVVALGPWSTDVLAPLGYRIPLAVKRGYHMHYGAVGNAVLQRPLLDADTGFVITPMTRGIRLTTGAEFADRDAPPSPIQLARCEPRAREIFPLGERLDPEPWMGRRPALPDMRPVIGPAPRHDGLWLAFGHAHHGFTLGPITGRLLAEMMTGEETVIDPKPYAVTRFG